MVAREYGLPTIVNVKGATKILKNGDHIKMNATKGTKLYDLKYRRSIGEV